MPTFLAYDVNVPAIDLTGSFVIEPPTYDVVDYELEPGVYASSSFVGTGPINRMSDGFDQTVYGGGISHFQNNNTFEMGDCPAIYELIWLPQPPESYLLEPTRYRKTYTFFRQRSRQK